MQFSTFHIGGGYPLGMMDCYGYDRRQGWEMIRLFAKIKPDTTARMKMICSIGIVQADARKKKQQVYKGKRRKKIYGIISGSMSEQEMTNLRLLH